MLRRRELKKKGKEAIYRNWAACAFVCFIYAILVGGTIIRFHHEISFDYRQNLRAIKINNIQSESNSDIVNEFILGLSGNKPINNTLLTSTTQGLFGTIFNNVSKSGSYLFGFLNAINQVLFKDRIWASVIIILGAILSLFYSIFVSKVLEVGNARFFLENKKYTKTKATKLILPFKISKVMPIAYTMFIKNLYTLLWGFTIVGAFIKHYAYCLVPYILAENPNMKTKDVIKLSETMMKGYKWEFFKLDLSFIGWYILGILTFNISNLVFATPYRNATKVEAYMYLRELSKTKGIINSDKLCDYNLDGDVVIGSYPIYDNMLKNTKQHKWLNINYKIDYKISDYILLFFVFAGIGWIYEVLLTLFEHGIFVNRGALYGPWLPIYGFGGLAILIFLKPFRKNVFAYFILIMFLCGVIEYSTSIYLEVVHHMAWWDYHGYFLNLNGRICLEGLLLFAIAGIFITYVAGPVLTNYFRKINKTLKMILCIILTCVLVLDFYVSTINPNAGNGISIPVSQSKLDKIKSHVNK